jgi:hypothetical protein
MAGPEPCCWLEQVGELASALRSSREEVAAQVAAANAKDRENSQLWEQVCMLISPCSDKGHWCRGHSCGDLISLDLQPVPALAA